MATRGLLGAATALTSMKLAYFALATFSLSFCTPGSLEAQDSDWSTYLGDPGRRHYSELDQINRDNVGELEVAWVYDSGQVRGGGSTMYTSPLIVDGVMYGYHQDLSRLPSMQPLVKSYGATIPAVVGLLNVDSCGGKMVIEPACSTPPVVS